MSYYSYMVRPLLAMMQRFQQGRESQRFQQGRESQRFHKGKPYEAILKPTQHLIIQA